MADFERVVQFTVQDVFLAKEEYEKLLKMAEIKATYLKKLNIKEPMDKLHGDILRSTLAEIIHLHRILGIIDESIGRYLDERDAKGHG